MAKNQKMIITGASLLQWDSFRSYYHRDNAETFGVWLRNALICICDYHHLSESILMTAEKPIPYWKKEADYSKVRFFIRRLSSSSERKLPSIPTATIPILGFLYLSGGEVLVEAGKESFLCKKGDILIIPENIPFSINFHETCSGYSGGFSIHLLKDVSYPVLQRGKPSHYHFLNEEENLVEGLFGMMERAFRQNNETLIVKALDLVLPLMGEVSSSPGRPVVRQFLEMVFDKDDAPKNAGAYASKLGVTLNYLNKTVRVQTGRTASQWVDISRINRAKELLQDNSVPVIDIAAAVGLDDQSYFARFFKKHTGLTPSLFRKTQK